MASPKLRSGSYNESGISGSDAGGFAPSGFELGSTQGDAHLRAERWRALFEPWGLWHFRKGTAGADVGPLMLKGVPVAEITPRFATLPRLSSHDHRQYRQSEFTRTPPRRGRTCFFHLARRHTRPLNPSLLPPCQVARYPALSRIYFLLTMARSASNRSATTA